MNSWEQRFLEFRESRKNSAYHEIVFPNGEILHGQWKPRDLWTAWKLPEDLSGKKVLDVGCNLGGWCIEAIRRRALRVDGVEATASTAEGARTVADLWIDSSRHSDELRKTVLNFHSVRLDCEIPAQLVRYDLILCLSVLQHTRFPASLVRNLAKLLEPGGTLYLEVETGQHGQDLLGQEPIPVWTPTVDALIWLAASAGLSVNQMVQGRTALRMLYTCCRPSCASTTASPKIGQVERALEELVTEL